MSQKIDLMIIGAQKAGSTAVKNYLDEHPQVCSHPHTEMTYFVDNEEFEAGFEAAFKKYFANKKLVAGEKVVAKNVTLSFREFGLARLAQHNPDCQIVFVLRNPIERAYSAYQMAVRGGWLDQPFSSLPEVVAAQRRGENSNFYKFIVDLGVYAPQVETVWKYFPKEQVHIFLHDDLKRDSASVCQKIYSILGVDDSFLPQTERKHNEGGVQKSAAFGQVIRFFRRKNNPVKRLVKSLVSEKMFLKLGKLVNRLNTKPAKYEPMSAAERQFLSDFYRPFNLECGRLIGRDLSGWG